MNPETTVNNIIEVEQTMVAEVACSKIRYKISFIMDSYGIIDRRRLLFLVDIVIYKGTGLDITQFGVSRSVLMVP